MMGSYEITQFIFQSGLLDTSILLVCAKVQSLCLLLLPMMFLINIGYNYWNSNTKSSFKFFDRAELMRTLALAFVITVYPAIFYPVGVTLDLINKYTAPNVQDMNKYSKVVADVANHEIQYGYASDSTMAVNSVSKDTKKEEDGSVLDAVKGAMSVSSWASGFITTAVGLVLAAIRGVISMVNLFLFKILFCIGPLAFLFSFIPAFKNKPDEWLGTYLNVGLTHTTYNILQHILINTLTKDAVLTGSALNDASFTNVVSDIGLNITLILCYLNIWWLTSKYVGTPDASKLGQTAMQIAQLVATGTSGGGGGAGSNTLQNATNTTKKGLEN
jgi:hypothetical protein